MKQFIISVSISAVIYLLIAISLVFWPVTRKPSSEGLAFDRLTPVSGELDGIALKSWKARDGAKLTYREAATGSHSSLILLHGSGGEAAYLQPLAKQLSQRTGINIILPDMRGHGLSMLDAPGDVSYVGQLQDDIDDLIRHLQQQGNTAIYLGGHSSGGGMALKYDGEYQTRVKGYLLFAPYLGYKAPTIRENSGGWVQVAMQRYIGLAMLNNIKISHFNHLPVLLFNRPAQWDTDNQLDSYSYRLNESLEPKDFQLSLSLINQPILLLAGEDDEAFYAERYADAFSSAADADIQLLPGVAHLDVVNHPKSFEYAGEWLTQLHR